MNDPPEFSRSVAPERIDAHGEVYNVAATEAECAAVARRLAIPAVTSLSCRFKLSRRPDDPASVEAELELNASVVQICVVTLEPFESPLRESARVRFVPGGPELIDDDPESEDEIPYDGCVIDLGEAAVEQLALALDPFPRRFAASLPDSAGESFDNPFAALQARREPS